MPNEAQANAEQSEQLQRQFMKVTRETPLHELVDRVLEIMTAVDAADGEVAPDQDALLTALDLSIERKVEAYAAAYQRLGADAEANKNLAAYYTAKSKKADAAGEQLRERLQAELERLGRDVVKTPTASATIQKSTERLVLAGDESELLARGHVPPRFVVTIQKIDRKALTEALRTPSPGSGITSIARLERGTHLRFR